MPTMTTMRPPRSTRTDGEGPSKLVSGERGSLHEVLRLQRALFEPVRARKGTTIAMLARPAGEEATTPDRV